MKVILCLLLTLLGTFAYDNSDEFINEINSKQNLWIAGRNFHKDTPMSRIRSLMGTRSLPQNILDSIPVVKYEVNDYYLPNTFDARTQWPKCKSIREIADQSACGSCWAVSVASAISDRICIHSDGKLQPEISAKNLIACSTDSNGCHGGYPYYAWQYWKSDGLVTGGSYGSNIGCQPYPFPQCEQFDEGPKKLCPDDFYATPKCVQKCDNSSMNYFHDLFYGETAFRVASSETQIQTEIMKNGPVVASFIIYSDFIHYKSGIYVKTNSTAMSSHAVRVIGWGEEKGTKYWLVMNSWNEDWGDKGTFKIRRGTDECFIESLVTAGLPH